MTIQEILQKLNNAGVTGVEIGRATGMFQSTISRLRTGVQKNAIYADHQAILKFAKKKLPGETWK